MVKVGVRDGCHLSNSHHRGRPLSSHLPGRRGAATATVTARRAPPLLDERVHGVDGRRGLRALVAFVRVFLFLAAVLADEGAIFVELSIPALPVVHQAVVALIAPHRAIGRRPAPLQRLVVLRVTRASGIKVRWEVTEKRL